MAGNMGCGFIRASLPPKWLPLGALHALAIASAFSQAASAEPIDRHALVSRHDPTLEQFDSDNPLSVGNGQFAFTVDATGLQTFPEAFLNTMPLGTLSQWGWHTAPNPHGWTIDHYPRTPFDSHGRQVGYVDIPGDRANPEAEFLRANPHRMHLGQIGFRLTKADGRPAQSGDLADVRQTLGLWDGIVRSHFRFEGEPVEVETICHPTLDAIAVRVESPLLAVGRLAIQMRFPYATGEVRTADWDHPEAHQTTVTRPEENTAVFARRLDDDAYSVAAQWALGGSLAEAGPHSYVLTPANNAQQLTLVCRFSPQPTDAQLPSFEETRVAARDHWNKFWSTGGAIDLSGSHDPRWRELERRIVLSQYLTAIQCTGQYPPQETGLTYNSWQGKLHLEMHWWHAVHFALWDRLELLERSLDYYQTILPRAIEAARRQGYAGARWPKMTDPSGAESPSTIGPFLIWQQPHPIYFAELAYRQHAGRQTLEKYRDVVFATAEFMASFASWHEATGRYVLGPPLQSAQEIFPKATTINPTFELTYWRWGLETAQHWRERLGIPRDPNWDRVLAHLSRPLVVDGKYAFTETALDSFASPRWARDHPIVLGSLGMLPGPRIDPPTMRRTLDWVWDNWKWDDTWGWDYPLVAMCAARVGEPARAVDALLIDTPKNTYRLNGHNYQRPGLSVYLPGNGGLLTAVAMMAAGWDGGPAKHAPGFPDDGTWQILFERLKSLP
jgi:hypothetical protein